MRRSSRGFALRSWTARRPSPSPATIACAGSATLGAVVELFVERVRDYEATVVVTDDPGAAVAEALAAADARRVGIAADLDRGLRAPGVELVEDDGLGARDLDALDGAVTTCAVRLRRDGHDRPRRRPGAGPESPEPRPRPARLRRSRRCDRRDGAGADRRARAERKGGPSDRPRLGPVGDERHRADPRRGRPRAAAARRHRRDVSPSEADVYNGNMEGLPRMQPMRRTSSPSRRFTTPRPGPASVVQELSERVRRRLLAEDAPRHECSSEGCARLRFESSGTVV